MRSILTLWFLLFVSIISTAAPSATQVTEGRGNFYNRVIYAEEIDNIFYKRSLADLKFFLEKATNNAFTQRTYKGEATEGIFILLNKPDRLTEDLQKKLEKGSVEDFVITGNDQRILLVASHPKGLSRAIYSYLDQLGFRWYFPGDDWTHIPNLRQTSLNKTIYGSPSYDIRDFFGTGGILPVKSIDPNASLQGRWDDWKRRNRLGGEIELAGHYGDVFNLNHRTELEKHPEYLALVKGKRVWSSSAKWCISNKNLRELFVRDRVAYLKDMLNKQGSAKEKITIPVDPADGYDHCECDDCKRLGTISDRVFLLANEVAKAVQKISPLAFPNLYAYNQHAAPPSFRLEPNLIVQVIPYVFQNIGSPQEMIAKWKKLHNNLYIYDYYGLPDWHFDLPMSGGLSPEALARKLKYWKESGMKGFILESSYGIGGAGLGLYMMARLGWDVNENPESIRKDYYEKMFAAGASEVRNYYAKVNGDFGGAADLPYLLNMLEKAGVNTKDIKAKSRIENLQGYLHYLVTYYQWESASAERKDEAWEELVNYVWKIYPTAMVHSTRIAELMFFKLPVGSALAKNWHVYEQGIKLSKIDFLSSRELSNLLKKDLEKYPLLQGFNYVKNRISHDYMIKSAASADIKNPEGMMLLDFPEIYVKAGTDGYFHFLLKVNESSDNNLQQTVIVQCIDTIGGKEMYKQQMIIDKKWKRVSIKLAPKHVGKLSVKNTNWIRLHVPNNQWAGFGNIPPYTVMGKLWFFVPSGTSYIYYSNISNEHPSIMDNQGKQIMPERVNNQNLYRVRVSSSSAGKWWTIAGIEYKRMQFFKMPDLFFSHPNYAVSTN